MSLWSRGPGAKIIDGKQEGGMSMNRLRFHIVLLAAVVFIPLNALHGVENLAKNYLEHLRSAQTVKIVVQENYTKADDVQLPFKKTVRDLFLYAGLKVLEDDAKSPCFTVRINVNGKSLGARYRYGKFGGETYRITGASLEGEFIIEIAGDSVWRKTFKAVKEPSTLIDKYTPAKASHYLKTAFNISRFTRLAASFTGEVFGAGSLVRALNAPARLVNVRKLRDVCKNILENDFPGWRDLEETKQVVRESVALLNEKTGGDAEREDAIRVLGIIRDPGSAGALIAALKDEKKEIRNAAASALGKLRDPRAVDALSTIIRDEKGYINASAASALGEIGDKRALELFLKELKTVKKHQRRILIRAMGNLGDPRAVKHMAPYVNDGDQWLRETVVNALLKIDDPVIKDPLLMVLRNKKERKNTRTLAAKGLVKLDSPGAREALTGLLARGDKDIKVIVAGAMGDSKDPGFVDSLLEALEDPDYSVRYRAVDALAKIKDKRAIPALIQAARDYSSSYKSTSLRSKAARALGELKAAAAVDVLIHLLSDKSYLQAAAAAEALAKIKDPRAVKPLIDKVDSDKPTLRKAVSNALQAITGNPSEMNRKQWKKWWKKNKKMFSSN
jgi:HEAT repeat protein